MPSMSGPASMPSQRDGRGHHGTEGHAPPAVEQIPHGSAGPGLPTVAQGLGLPIGAEHVVEADGHPVRATVRRRRRPTPGRLEGGGAHDHPGHPGRHQPGHIVLGPHATAALHLRRRRWRPRRRSRAPGRVRGARRSGPHRGRPRGSNGHRRPRSCRARASGSPYSRCAVEVALGQPHRSATAQVDGRDTAPSAVTDSRGDGRGQGHEVGQERRGRCGPTSRGGTGPPTASPAPPVRPPGRRSHRSATVSGPTGGRRSARSRPTGSGPRPRNGAGSVSPRAVELVPLHLRVLDPVGQTVNRPGQQAQSLGLGALGRALVEQLEADADAEEGHAGRHGGAGGRLEPAGPQGAGAGPEGPHAGQHDGIGRLHLGWPRSPVGRRPRRVGVPSRPSAGSRCRSRGRRSSECAHRLPLVDGMPPPSMRTASRRLPGHALEGGLEHVVGVLALLAPDVQRQVGRGGEGPPELLGQLRVEGRRAQARPGRRRSRPRRPG